MSISKIVNNRDHTIVSCTPQDSVQLAATLLADKKIGALPVMDGDGIAGIFSERDLLYCVARDGAEVLPRPVGEVMTSPAITIDLDTDALKALSLMTRRRIRHLPVMDGAKMVGFVSIGDLVKWKIEETKAEANAMADYIKGQ